jgi:voltage-gated potassium channel
MTPPTVRRRLRLLVIIPAILLVAGTVGYRAIEGPNWSWLDALYMTAITLTTVGFLEVHELSPAGRLFTACLCLGGVSLIFYTFGEVVRIVITGELRRELGRGSMERTLAALNDHIIVCGYGRVGRLVARQLQHQKRPHVVVERGVDLLEPLIEEEVPYVHGDATAESVLKEAGVERAAGLVAAVASDADNLYITLSARLLNERLLIVARCEDEAAADKFRRVGANHVVSPYVIGGLRIAQAVTRPSVTDFLDQFTVPGQPVAQIEEVRLAPESRLVGRTLAELRLSQELGLTLVAIRERGGGFVATPTDERVLEPGQTLIVVGHRRQLDELEKLAAGRG